jgi:choline transport protein
MDTTVQPTLPKHTNTTDLELGKGVSKTTTANKICSGEDVTVDNLGRKMEQNFSLLSLAAVGLVVGNVWPALGGTLLVAINNGGRPGVIYEFITVSVFYWTVAASLAEFASAMPSSQVIGTV